MNSHLIQGTAAMIVSQFLNYCLSEGMTDEILKKRGYESSEADQIKQAIQAIADQQRLSAEYHKSILKAIPGSEAGK
jgi:hypothetical protein